MYTSWWRNWHRSQVMYPSILGIRYLFSRAGVQGQVRSDQGGISSQSRAVVGGSMAMAVPVSDPPVAEP